MLKHLITLPLLMLAVIVCGSPTDYVIGGVPADTIVAPAKPDVVIRDTTLMDGTPYTGSTAGTAGTAGISATAPDIPAFPRGAWDLSLQPRPGRWPSSAAQS